MTLLPDWLAEAVLRATCVVGGTALLVAMVTRVLRLRSPKVEQLAWSLVLAQGLLLAPIAIELPHGWWPQSRAPQRSSSAVMPNIRTGREWALRSAASTPVDDTRALDSPRAASRGASRISYRQPPAPTWQTIFLRVWMIGLVGFATMGYLRYRAFVCELARCTWPRPEWEAEWREVLAAAGCTQPILLIVSARLGPALCWTPAGYRLVVPRERWQRLTADQRRAVLQHELAHYRRGDIWRSLVARLVALVHWFNPLAWLAVRRLEAQFEFACDQWAASESSTSLGEALVALASRNVRQPLLTTAAGNRSVVQRVRRLLGEPRGSSSLRNSLALAMVLLVVAAVSVKVSVAQQADDASAPGDIAVRLSVDQFRIAGHVADLAVSPDGKQLVAIAPNRVTPTCWLIDAETLEQIEEIRLADDAKGWISTITFSPDSQELLWGELHGYVAVWNLAEHRLVFREQIHTGEVHDVAYSSSGKLFATAGADGLVHVYQRTMPEPPYRTFATGANLLAGGEGMEASGGAACVTFSPDESIVFAGASSHGDIFMWQLDNERRLHYIRKAHDPAGSYNPVLINLRVTPDGKSLMSAGQKTVPRSEANVVSGSRNVPLAEIRFWDIESGAEQRTLNAKDWCSFGHADLSPDGTKVALAEFSRLQILDAKTGETLQSFMLPGEWCDSPRFSADGSRVYMPIDNTVASFDIETGARLLHSDATPIGMIDSFAYSPNEKQIATGHGDGYVRLWDTTTRSPVWLQLLAPVVSRDGWKARPAFIGFTPDGKQMVVAGRRNDPEEYREGVVVVLDAETGGLVREMILDTDIRGAALSPDGKTVVAFTSNGGLGDTRLHAIDVDSGAEQYTYPPETGRKPGLWSLVAMEFTADGDKLLVADGNGDTLVLDAATGKLQKQFVADWRDEPTGKAKRKEIQVWGAAFSADGSTLVANSAESVYIWDVESGKLQRTIRHPHDHGCHLAVSPDASRFATADRNYAGDPGTDKVLLYDTQTGEQIAEFLQPGSRAYVLEFSPDGSQLTAGFTDGSVTIWDLP